MTKTTFVTNHLIGGLLTVSEAQSIIIMADSMAAGRNDTIEAAESNILTCMQRGGGEEKGEVEKGGGREGRQERGRHTMGLAWAFKTLKPILSDTLPPTGPHLLIFLILSNGSTPWAYGDHCYSNHHT